MAEEKEPAEDHPQTLEELEKELDKDALTPEDITVEDETKEGEVRDETIPHPRDPGLEDMGLTEGELQEASMETEAEPEPILKNDDQLHVEEQPKPVSTAPFYRRAKFWVTTIFFLIVALTFTWFIRPARIYMVNLVGLKTQVTVTAGVAVEEGQASAQLNNVTISLNGVDQQVDEGGQLKTMVPFGDLHIEAKKTGYEPASQVALLDFDPFFYMMGGKQQDEAARDISLSLKAVGVAFAFNASDWLSGKPLTAGKYIIGDLTVRPDSKGKVSLRLPDADAKSVKISAEFGGSYIDKSFKLPLGSVQTITFVPTGRHYYVGESLGSPAVLSSNFDGSNKQTVVAGDDNETAAMNFTVSPDGKFGVLASTRDNTKDIEDSIQQKLFIVDLATKKLKSVDKGLWFNLVDWSGNTLIYSVGERLAAGAPLTHRLASIDTSGTTRKDLAEAANFTTIRVAAGRVVYIRGFKEGETGAGNGPEVRTIPVKGGTEKSLGYKIQKLTQEDADKFNFLTTGGDWQQYNANTDDVSNVSTPTATNQAFLMTASADGQHRIGINRTQAIPSLVLINVATAKQTKLYGAAGITGPVRWVGNILTFRVVTDDTTTDYAMSLSGGEPKAILNVTPPNSNFQPPPGFISFF